MNTFPASLSFQDTPLTIVDHNGRPCLTAADLARALGYARQDSVSRIYDRNRDEFSPNMTETVKLTAPGINDIDNTIRIFSPRGCYLIAMFAKTDKAKAFRRWVLDVLDGLGLHAPPPAQTVSKRQLQDLSRVVRDISLGMGQPEAVKWNCWHRLREHFGVSPINRLPATDYDDAMAILERMHRQSEVFKRWRHEAEACYCRDVLRLGGNLAELEQRLIQQP